MKRSSLVFSLGMAVAANAELDLQLEGRFNPLGPAKSEFQRLVPDNDNGFYAAGSRGSLGFIARFDGNANLLGTQHFDHPLFRFGAFAKKMVRDEIGRITVTYYAGGASTLYGVAQYSPTLQHRWAYASSFPSAPLTATLPGGETAIAYKVGTSVEVRVLSSDGVLLFTKTFLGVDKFRAVCAVPTAEANRGFALAGQKGQQGWVARFDLAQNTLYDVIDTAMAGPDSGITTMEADVDGVISGMGAAGPTENTSYYRVAPNGVVTQAFDQTFPAGGASNLELLPGNITRASQTRFIIDFDRTTLTVVRRFGNSNGEMEPQHNVSFAQDSAGTLFAGIEFGYSMPSGDYRFETWPATGGDPGEQIETNLAPFHGKTLSGGRAQFVGVDQVSKHAAISAERQTSFVTLESFPTSGYNSFPHIHSAIGPTGEISMLTRLNAGDLPPGTNLLTYMVQFDVNGKLKFSRHISGMNPHTVHPMEDGSFIVFGLAIANTRCPMVVRINAQGVTTRTNVYDFSSQIDGASLTPILGSPDVMLMVLRKPGNMALVRVRPDGSFAYNVGYSSSTIASRLISLPSGKLGLMQALRAGSQIILRRINAVTGLPEKSNSIGVEVARDFVDMPGSAIAMGSAEGRVCRVRRIDEATMAPTHTVDLDNRFYDYLTVGATGRIALQTRASQQRRVSVYNPTNLTTAHAEIVIPSSSMMLGEITMTNANQLYYWGGVPNSEVTWLAKYSSTGQLLQERHPTGSAGRVFSNSVAIWATGVDRTLLKGSGPVARRYTR